MSRKKNVTLTRKRLIYVGLLSTMFLLSCTAVRTITNTAESMETEEGNKVIQTRVIESYIATKSDKSSNILK